MAINKKLQKMFYFSSEYTKKFIEKRIDDIAIKTQRSSSYIIENLLLDELLPQYEEAQDIILYNLYSNSEDTGDKNTLTALFSSNAAGINWKSKHNNFKPLIAYCLLYCNQTSHYRNEPNLDYLISQLQDIVERIRNCVYACIEPYDRKMYSSYYNLAKLLLDKAKEKPDAIVYYEYFDLINMCWDMLYDWSITFRFLTCITQMCDFCEENSNARNSLYEIILELSSEW